ncbi:MAG: hydroxymethylbilane synthase [Planctomycetes bacterium RBG_16_55_9]|nr:MAG: hydroxymethylbilane synthase [Planctomycetes bacterium RBG_16_55_9]
MRALTVATRGGALAIAQTEHVVASLKRIHPGIEIEIRQVATSGDRDRRTALWNLKDTGFFTSQLEDILSAGEADFAVHSFKDLPTAEREGLTIAAVFDRNFVEDCLVCPSPLDSLKQLPSSARIGTSSLRRAAQLKHLRPDVDAAPIRGNVQTRLRKLDTDEFDAILLARAGLERLGLADRISLVFDPTEFIPAPAQGALGIQTRADDVETNEIIAAIDDRNARTTTAAERKILTTMQCGCHAPVGAYAKITGGDIKIHAFISDLQGKNFISREITGPAKDAEILAEKIAKQLLKAGGKEILESLEK